MEQVQARDFWLKAAADQFGTPCYVYDLGAVEKRLKGLRASFQQRFSISFAVKSNPNPGLLQWLKTQVDCLDVSSIGEFRSACAAGWSTTKLSFTGPGKRQDEIVEALTNDLGELVVESLCEASMANDVAARLNRRQPILVRLSPDRVPKGFGDHMAGRPSPFGVDVEESEKVLSRIIDMPALELRGFHIFSGTQCLKADAVCENYRIFLNIFREVCERHRIKPHKLIFGSGLGIPYAPSDVPIDIEYVGREILLDLDLLRGRELFHGAELVLETGRYVVGEAGFFVTRVVATKQSRGTRIAICDGGMNNHLAASGHFGMVMHRNYPMHKVGGQGPLEPVNLVGPLCTSIDRLANHVELPALEAGDLIAIHSSGAYGLTASPIGFISHPVPREILLDDSGLREASSRIAGPAA